MILWAAIAGMLVAMAAIGPFGFILGGVVGAMMGVWLRSIMAAEVAREVSRHIAGLEFTTAAPAQVSHPAAAQPYTPQEDWLPPAEEEAPPPVAEPSLPAAPESAPSPQPTASVPVTAPTEDLEPAWREPAIAKADSYHYTANSYADQRADQADLFDKARGWLLGGNTIVRVGLVVLFVGLSFLARLAINAGLFPLEARLASVGAAGAALLALGFRKRIERPAFGLSLQGTGVAVLYLTVFASSRLYELLPLGAAFGFMILFAALGCALAVMQNSLAMALCSFIGGFAVPILLGGESPTPLPLFTYYTVLNLAILVIAWKKSWRPLNLLGFFVTFGLATVWGMTSYSDQHYMVTQVFLVVSIAIYLATALLYAHNTPGSLGNAVDSTLLFGPALAGFGLQVGLVDDLEFGSAFSALAFGAAYLGIATFTLRKRQEEMRLLSECVLAIGVGFVTLAVPLALDAKWTSAAWALEGAGAFWVGARQARWMPRAFGLLLQLVAAFILTATLELNVSAIPIANNGFVGPLLIALPMLFSAWQLRRELPHSGSTMAQGYAGNERMLEKLWFLIGFAFAAIALVQEVTRSLPATTSESYPQPVLTEYGQAFGVMLALLGLMTLSDWLGRRANWTVASMPARLSLFVLWAGFLASLVLERHVLYLPDVAVWVVAIVIHGLLVRRRDRDKGDEQGGFAGFIHMGGAWLLTAMLADSLDLGIDQAQLWDTSWAGVIPLVGCTAVLALLTRWAGRAAPLPDTKALGWPLHPHARAYWWGAAVPLVVLAYGGALAAAIVAEGLTDPLPYVPLINPVDLSVALALASLIAWRRMVLGAKRLPIGAEVLPGKAPLVLGAALGFVWINMIWLRSAHHYLDIAWDSASLLASPAVQTGLSILWTLMAMALMLFAKRRALRLPWLTGAILLGVVVVKLLLVDMSTAQSWARIVAFIGVGVLMLAIGYFVPLPPHPDSPDEDDKR